MQCDICRKFRDEEYELECDDCGTTICYKCGNNKQIPKCPKHESGVCTFKRDANIKIEGNKLIVDNKKYDTTSDVNLFATKITVLPDNLQIGGLLNVGLTEITSLPKNLQVGGSLDARWISITSLPENLWVGDSLDVRFTDITTLPESLQVGNFIYLHGTNIKKESVPKHLIDKCRW